MRTILLLPLTAIVAVAGCSSARREPTARSDLQRDLTLATRGQEVAVASPVELGQIQPLGRTSLSIQRVTRSSPARQRKPHAPKVMTAVMAASPAPVLAVPQPVMQPVSSASEPANERELLPGKTVSVIPVSSGPSVTPAPAPGEFPVAGRGWGMGGGSGMGGRGCRGRGPGIGIAGAPSPAYR